ncbi:MAG: prenyltransferase [Phycisphaerae bacterium]
MTDARVPAAEPVCSRYPTSSTGLTVGRFLRALRLPFCFSSVLPYVFGALLAVGEWHWFRFALGFGVVLCTHLAANLVDDYADSASGVDDYDHTHYGLFGGSKLIQEGVLSPQWYFRAAVSFAGIAAAGAAMLGVLMRQWEVPAWFAAVLAVAWMYSHGPFRLAYHGLGELTIVLTFGPAAVVGGAYIQQGARPGWSVVAASLPMGLLVAAILVMNEIPDAPDDASGNKRTLVVRLGAARGWLLLAGVLASIYLLIVALVAAGVVSPWALGSLATVPLAVSAVRGARRDVGDKRRLMRSSRKVILIQLLAGLSLVVGAAT